MSTVPTDLENAANGTTGAPPAWKQELNGKIAAARAKRHASPQGPDVSRGEVLRPGHADSRASRVAAAVAARYAQAPSYSEYLATEVRAAVMAAAAAQQTANQAAAQVMAVQAELEAARQPIRVEPVPESRTLPAPAPPRAPSQPIAPRIDYAASGIPARAEYSAQTPAISERPSYTPAPVISDPLAEALITPSTPLPSKLLEFPRELVATRKARPRHAEGPLRDENSDEPQLRIFEVEPEAISKAVEPAPQATEWSSIRLDAYPPDYAVQSATDTVSSSYPRNPYPQSGVSPRHGERPYPSESSYVPSYAQARAQTNEAALLKVASLEDRMMAGLVDFALVGIAFLLFVFIFSATTVHPPTGKPALLGSAVILAGLYLAYQFLFFTFSDSTPGMLYARIALCTFDDDNPTREAMRKRIFALVLAAMPLGLGFLYAIFDEDHLGWHDRMTRMYQRSYK